MKILYSAGNYFGANIFLGRFLENIKGHDIKVLAFYENSSHLHHIDWTTDGLYGNHKLNQWKVRQLYDIDEKFPTLDIDNNLLLYNEILDWEPDLIISDVEPISAFLAHSIGIELWYCSPFLLLSGIFWDCKKQPALQQKTNKINSLPSANKYLINSPFCDIANAPKLKPGFDWIRPYFRQVESQAWFDKKILPQNVEIVSGTSSLLSDCIYNNLFSLILHEDEEQLLNSTLAEYYKIGLSIGKKKDLNMVKFFLERIDPNFNYLNIKNYSTLDELIKEEDDKKNYST